MHKRILICLLLGIVLVNVQTQAYAAQGTEGQSKPGEFTQAGQSIELVSGYADWNAATLTLEIVLLPVVLSDDDLSRIRKGESLPSILRSRHAPAEGETHTVTYLALSFQFGEGVQPSKEALGGYLLTVRTVHGKKISNKSYTLPKSASSGDIQELSVTENDVALKLKKNNSVIFLKDIEYRFNGKVVLLKR